MKRYWSFHILDCLIFYWKTSYNLIFFDFEFESGNFSLMWFSFYSNSVRDTEKSNIRQSINDWNEWLIMNRKVDIEFQEVG